MQDDEFTKLFKYMERRFDAIERQLDGTAKASDVERVRKRFDEVVSILDDQRIESAAVVAELDRHEEWIIHQLADASDVNLRSNR